MTAPHQTSHAWLYQVLEDILRYCIEHGLFEVAQHLSDAVKSLNKNLSTTKAETLRTSKVTLHLALESCYHLSDALGLEDVTLALSDAISLVDQHHKHSNIVDIGATTPQSS